LLLVRQESQHFVTHAKIGPSVDISRGYGGQKTSKRGAVSIDFSLTNGLTQIRIVNLNIDDTDSDKRLKDLHDVLAEHHAFQDSATHASSALFVCGGMNFPVEINGESMKELKV
jgi:hypothetical protein